MKVKFQKDWQFSSLNFQWRLVKPELNVRDYIGVKSRSMDKKKIGEAVSAGQLSIQLANSLL